MWMKGGMVGMARDCGRKVALRRQVAGKGEKAKHEVNGACREGVLKLRCC